MSRPHCILALSAITLLSGGCKKSPEEQPGPQGINLVWPTSARCTDESVNEFVTQAVQHCVQGNYEEYRLLWRYDHQPTSRRNFERLWNMVEEVQVRQLRPLRFQLADGSFHDQECYVFHAFVRLREQAKERLRERLADRDLVLLIANDGGTWRFAPAGAEVKAALLGTPAQDPVAAGDDPFLPGGS